MGAIGYFEYRQRKLCLHTIDCVCEFIHFECDDHEFNRADFQPGDDFLRRIGRASFTDDFGQWNRGNLGAIGYFKYCKRKLCVHTIDFMCGCVHAKCDHHEFGYTSI